MNALTITDRRDLERLESIIEKGVKQFVSVGNALAEIRERRLYHENHDAFEDYCQQVWGFTKQRASQLIQAAKVEAVCQPVVDVPNERVARAIAAVPEAEREKVVEWAAEKAEGKPLTAAAIERAAAEFAEAEPEEEEPEEDEAVGGDGQEESSGSDGPYETAIDRLRAAANADLLSPRAILFAAADVVRECHATAVAASLLVEVSSEVP